MKSANFFLGLMALALLACMPSIGQANGVLVVPPAFSIPGIAGPGFPSFTNAALITQNRIGFGADAITQLTATHTSSGITFHSGNSSAYLISNPSFLLSANFDSTGAFKGGSVSINGVLTGYNGPGIAPPPTLTNLYLANLSAFGFDMVNDSSPVALGFKTDQFSGWASQFQSAPESVYLYGFNVVGFMNNLTNPKFKSGTFAGSAYTTVPVPAAAWLFGSAAAMLTVLQRKKALTV